MSQENVEIVNRRIRGSSPRGPGTACPIRARGKWDMTPRDAQAGGLSGLPSSAALGGFRHAIEELELLGVRQSRP